MKVGFGPVLAVNLDHCCFVHVGLQQRKRCVKIQHRQSLTVKPVWQLSKLGTQHFAAQQVILLWNIPLYGQLKQMNKTQVFESIFWMLPFWILLVNVFVQRVKNNKDYIIAIENNNTISDRTWCNGLLANRRLISDTSYR